MWPFPEWKKTWEDPAWLAVVAPESTEGRVAGAGGGAGLGLAFYTRLRHQIGTVKDWEGPCPTETQYSRDEAGDEVAC